MKRSQHEDVVRLGFYGLTPFVASAVVLWLSPLVAPQHIALDAHRFTLVYGAIVVSFLAGIGAAASIIANREERSSFLPPIIVTLVAVIAIVPDGTFFYSLGAAWRHLIILLALLYLLMRDMAAVDAGFLPRWYGALRSRLTFWAVLSLALIISRLMLWGFY